MDPARVFIDSYNAIAQDWARTQSPSGRPFGLVPPMRSLVCQRSGPESTLDLRDSLSVIEVYADPDPSDVAPFTLELRMSARS